MKTRSSILVVGILFLSSAVLLAAELAAPPRFDWRPKPTPLPAATGQIIRVTDVNELFAAAEKVQPGGTILLADGIYRMPRYFELHTDRVTLRGETGRREKVVLDGAESRHGELLGISRCSGVTVADLTIQNVKWNGLKINSDLGVSRVTVYNCVIHNIWQRGIKGPAVPKPHRGEFAANCRVEHCLFYNDRPKQFSDDPADTPSNFGGNYVGGIDVMYPKGWTIRDNVFVGIQGRTRAARGAVFLWHEAEDCVVERNVIVDCDSGICLGNSHLGPETKTHAIRCIVRNNFVVRCPEQGILADYTHDCKILHNTIHDPGSRLRRLIRLVHDNHGLVVANNLLSGPPMRVETESKFADRGNVNGVLTDQFADVRSGDLHLKATTPGETGVAERIAEVPDDIDAKPRRQRTDAGADECDK